MEKYALTTDQDTAAAETGLCAEHYKFEGLREAAQEAADKDVTPDSWQRVDDNPAISCQVCGAS